MRKLDTTQTKRAVRASANALGFIPANASRTTRSRLNIFINWLDDTGGSLLQPNLAAFSHYLETERGLTARSAAAYVVTVRARYKKHILKSNVVDTLIERSALAAGYRTPADVRALVERTKTRLQNALDTVTLPKAKQQIQTDSSKGRWLQPDEVPALLNAPDKSTVVGLRDYTIFLLMLSTGLRAAELCNVRVSDVHETVTNEANGSIQPGLRVTDGKGAKSRFVPYGGNATLVLNAVRHWQKISHIHSGFLFRALTAAGAAKDKPTVDDLRTTRMATRTLNYIFERYPVTAKPVTPHDMRRTYAYTLYRAGVQVADIQQLLGHASYETTIIYLGLNENYAAPPALWDNLLL